MVAGINHNPAETKALPHEGQSALVSGHISRLSMWDRLVIALGCASQSDYVDASTIPYLSAHRDASGLQADRILVLLAPSTSSMYTWQTTQYSFAPAGSVLGLLRVLQNLS